MGLVDFGCGHCIAGCQQFAHLANHDSDCVSAVCCGSDGYDVQYMTQKELIADMIKQYERYLNLLAGVGQELMGHEQVELAE